jgi:hypothetical protein
MNPVDEIEQHLRHESSVSYSNGGLTITSDRGVLTLATTQRIAEFFWDTGTSPFKVAHT